MIDFFSYFLLMSLKFWVSPILCWSYMISNNQFDKKLTDWPYLIGLEMNWFNWQTKGLLGVKTN